MATIFSRIVAGEIPCYKVAEDEHHLAFLDIQPITRGHTLVIPKMRIDYLFDLEDAPLTRLLLFTKKVALGVQKAVPCRRIGMSVVGLEIPHAHVHLVPIDTADDLNFTRPKLKPSQDELKEAQQKILQALN